MKNFNKFNKLYLKLKPILGGSVAYKLSVLIS